MVTEQVISAVTVIMNPKRHCHFIYAVNDKYALSQLKNLFKEREKKDAGNAESSAAAAQTEASLTQRWSPTARAARVRRLCRGCGSLETGI